VDNNLVVLGKENREAIPPFQPVYPIIYLYEKTLFWKELGEYSPPFYFRTLLKLVSRRTKNRESKALPFSN